MVILGHTRPLHRTAHRVQSTPKPLETAFLYPMALVRCASLFFSKKRRIKEGQTRFMAVDTTAIDRALVAMLKPIFGRLSKMTSA
jgi:hypothetical protein